MKWILIFCLVLTSTAHARPRTKRSIGHIKSLIVNKLLGIGGKTVIIARPILSNNETYQLFRIPGIEDFLVKVSKNDKKLEKDKQAQEIKDPVIVKPEVAIIGSYLGTTTQKETLLAIEMVKNLVRSGILTGRLDSSMQELLIPQAIGGYINEGVLTKPMQVITEEEEHIFVPEYPKFFIPPEVNLAKPNFKYYYKQEGSDADMTYESHDNNVFVTRTEKKPQNLQVSDAAKNVGNNNSAPISQPLKINGPPAPYYVNKGLIAGRIPLPAQNPLYNVNEGLSGNMTEKGQNSSPPFYLNQGTIAGRIPLPTQNRLYNVNQGISVNMPETGQNLSSAFYANQGSITGRIPLPAQNQIPSFNDNQGMFLNMPEEGQNSSPALLFNQGMNAGRIPLTTLNQAPFYNLNRGVSGNMPEEGQNPSPAFYFNHGIKAGRIPLPTPNQIPLYNMNQGLPGNMPEEGQNPSPAFYFNHGIKAGRIPLPTPNQIPLYNMNQGLPGNMPEIGQNPPFYFNQGTLSGKVPGKGQNPPPGDFANQGVISGNMPGLDQLSTPGYYDQAIISGPLKIPPSYYVNQGITGGILGQAPYVAPYNVDPGMIESSQEPVGNAPPTNNIIPNLMAGNFGAVHPPPVYYVSRGDIEGNPGQIPPYLSHGIGIPNINEIGLINKDAIMADRNPPLQMDAILNPLYFGNDAQKVIVCKEKQDKPCPYNKIEKSTLNPTQNINKPAINQQSVANTNSTFRNAKKNAVKEFLKNHIVNNQIVAQYSYQQINSQSNNNHTEVKLVEPAVVETDMNLNKDFVLIPPDDSSIALSLINEEQIRNNDKNAFTSKVNLRTNKEDIKRFMPPNRLKSNVKSPFKQNPIVVADMEKRSNELNRKGTKSDENSNGEIPGSTF